MSWGISITGTRKAVIAKVSAQLDKIAAGYEGKEEANDVRAAKDRILAIVDGLELCTDQYGVEWNAVDVKAGGSHSTVGNEGKIISATMQITVSRTSLALD